MPVLDSQSIWMRMRSWFRGFSLRDLLTYFLFVLFSAILWYGHAMHSVRNAVIPIPVQYIGVPSAISFDRSLPDTLQVEVRDAGRRLRMYYQRPPVLTIDVSAQIHGKSGSVRISSEQLRRSLTDILQGTTKLQAVMPEQLSGSYYRQVQKMVPVLADAQIVPEVEYQLTVEPQAEPKEVAVYGTERDLDTLSRLFTEPIRVISAKDTIRIRAGLICPPGVRLSQDSVWVQAAAERFTEKCVHVPVHVTGVPEGCRLRIFPNEVDVTIRVALTHFAEVDESSIKVICAYASQESDRIPLAIQYSNPDILSARVYPESVEFLIEH